jgi:hypothetical protein
VPGRQEHRLISKFLTGTEGDAVHDLLDKPFTLEKTKSLLTPGYIEALYRALRPTDSQYTQGHRQAFHTPTEAVLIGNLVDGPRGARAALTHLLADEVFHDADAKVWLRLLMAKSRQK